MSANVFCLKLVVLSPQYQTMTPSLILYLLLFILHCNGDVIIETNVGAILGNSYSANSKTVYNFNGIRYATPPVGDLRFRPSVLNGTLPGPFPYDARQPRSECIQPYLGREYILRGEEDCLFLNIFTTKSNVDHRADKLVSVMLFIHGGGFTMNQSGMTWTLWEVVVVRVRLHYESMRRILVLDFPS